MVFNSTFINFFALKVKMLPHRKGKCTEISRYIFYWLFKQVEKIIHHKRSEKYNITTVAIAVSQNFQLDSLRTLIRKLYENNPKCDEECHYHPEVDSFFYNHTVCFVLTCLYHSD